MSCRLDREIRRGGSLSESTVVVHELIAWDLDEYSYRGSGVNLSKEEFAAKLEQARQRVFVRNEYEPCSALLDAVTEQIFALLSPQKQRIELHQEYKGLDWTLGVVDLRRLLAFQRRLIFDPEISPLTAPQPDDWPRLIAITLGAQRSTEHSVTSKKNDGGFLDVSLRSSNPDLQLRLSADAGHDNAPPFSLYGGSPFFEVAEFCGRWFLRDGYHRAYGLLQAGIHSVPAVVIHAKTIEELGATQPWFFSEDQLLSSRPPRVVDFLDDNLVLRYRRPRLIKTIRIQIEESLEIV
jgi:hypothetical protein